MVGIKSSRDKGKIGDLNHKKRSKIVFIGYRRKEIAIQLQAPVHAHILAIASYDGNNSECCIFQEAHPTWNDLTVRVPKKHW